MMQQLSDFALVKSEMVQCAEELAILAQHQDKVDLADRAEELLGKLAAGEFNLTVFGQFKRGKSTLINALLGVDILPTAVVPLTSIVTILRYGRAPAAKVTFTDGRRVSIAVSEISEYITERGNPPNEKGVRRVEVSYPAPLLKDGVRLIDTPGAGSIFLNNTEATYDFLPNADAAILILAADQPISQAEVEFLHEARRYAAKFFFLLNKIDLLSERELLEPLEFCRRVIEEELQTTDLVLYPLSAKQALIGRLQGDRSLVDRSRVPGLEYALTQFLLREKGTTLLGAARRRLYEMAVTLEQAIDLELTALMLTPQEVAEKIELFHQQADRILQEQQDVEYLLHGETGRLIARVEEDLRPLVEDHVDPLRRRLAEFFNVNKHLGKFKLVEAMTNELAGAVQEIFTAWHEQEETIISQEFTRITARFQERMNQIVEVVQDVAKGLFGVEVTPVMAVEPLTTESSHYYLVENPFTLQADTIVLMLPAPIAKRIIRRRFLENARLELDRNAGRWRSDFQERIEKSARRFRVKFQEQVEDALRDIQRTLERAAQERAQSEERVAATLDTLQAAQREIRALGQSLDQLTPTPNVPVAWSVGEEQIKERM
ncbi:MAG: dynamin family protein [Acidobacteria bacterium]|nr:dynamin family protein [Acidobacteriota bacterium]